MNIVLSLVGWNSFDRVLLVLNFLSDCCLFDASGLT